MQRKCNEGKRQERTSEVVWEEREGGKKCPSSNKSTCPKWAWSSSAVKWLELQGMYDHATNVPSGWPATLRLQSRRIKTVTRRLGILCTKVQQESLFRSQKSPTFPQRRRSIRDGQQYCLSSSGLILHMCATILHTYRRTHMSNNVEEAMIEVAILEGGEGVEEGDAAFDPEPELELELEPEGGE